MISPIFNIPIYKNTPAEKFTDVDLLKKSIPLFPETDRIEHEEPPDKLCLSVMSLVRLRHDYVYFLIVLRESLIVFKNEGAHGILNTYLDLDERIFRSSYEVMEFYIPKKGFDIIDDSQKD